MYSLGKVVPVDTDKTVHTLPRVLHDSSMKQGAPIIDVVLQCGEIK